jgi:subtilase family serine protease
MRLLKAVTLSLLLAALFSTLCLAAPPDRITSPVVARQTVQLPAGVPLQARPEFDQGTVDPSMKMSYMTLLIVPSANQQKAINRLLAQQQDRHSPLYHKWITPEQYADRFSLSPNDVKKITVWLQSQGFSVSKVARSRNLIAFDGTAAQVESAFQTELHNYNVGGEVHFANAIAPSIPAALSGVVSGIGGLSNFRAKSYATHTNPDYTLPQNGSDYLFLAPGDIATIYDINALYNLGIDGTGQKLVVAGETDVFLADLNDFRSGFGLTQISGCTTNANKVITACNTTNFKYVVVGTDPGVPNSLQDDLLEADIDLEWSAAVARKAQIIYVNAPATANGVWDAWHTAITDNLAPVITLSYGLCELGEALNGEFSADEGYLQQASTQGITFLNSSGDSGAASCDFQTNYPTGGYAVSYPASSPEVTGVGGTLIPYTEFNGTYWNLNNTGDGGSAIQYMPEEVWNDEQEWSEYCTANPSSGTCSSNPGLSSWATAQETYIGVFAGGGGLSNCFNETGGVCATPPNGGFPQPTWQASLAVPGSPPLVRYSPDVSLLSSVYWPGFIICTPAGELQGFTGTTSTCANGIASALTTYNHFRVGGTSVASPIFAGIVTLLNQYLAGGSSPGLGNINTQLYFLAATPTNGAFHSAVSPSPSLTFGSDGAFCSPGTPIGFPPALQCPSSGLNAGFLGFDASVFDPTTGYSLTTGLGSVDANNLALAWAASRTSTTASLAATPTSTYEGVTVTLTATVAPSSATGTVKFLNGTTSIGTATLSGGTATLTTTTLPVATNSITATYEGDITDATSTSPAVDVTVALAYTLSGTDMSVTQGNPGTSTITVVPASGFTTAINFTCSDPAAKSTCSFNPTSITPPGTTTTTLTVTTTAATAQLHMPFDHAGRLFYAVLLPGFLGIVLTMRSRKPAARGLRLLSFIVVLGCSTLLLPACGGGGGGGGGGGNPGTPKGQYTITVTATAGTVHHATTVKLTVN